jgi:ankyrin repeat protein
MLLITFSDYSTQEFLRDISFSIIPHPQAFLAATCLVFVTQHADMVQTGVPEDRSFPFLDYAYTNWGGHAQSSQQLGEPLHPSIIPSLFKCRLFPFSVEEYGKSVTPTLRGIGSQRIGFGTEIVVLPSLTVASMYGLVDVVKSEYLPFLRTPTASLASLASQNATRAVATPFHSATTFGHLDTFIALLSTYGTLGIPLWTSKELLLPPITHLVVVSPRSGAPFLQNLFGIIDSPPNAEIRLALSEFNINLQSSEGNTALILACKNVREDVVHVLLSQQGVEANLQDNTGHDAFHWSMKHPESGVALLLLTHFPTLDIEAADQGGVTALMTACLYGHQQVIDYIRTKKPNEWARLIRRTDLGGRTALMMCSRFPWTRGPERETIIRTLIANGSDLHARETEGGMATFLYAIQHRGGAQLLITHILKPLLEYDPSAFDQRDNHGRTALMLELRSFRPDETLLKFLVSLTPTPEQYLNLRDADGHSALMHAIGEGSDRSPYNHGRVDAVKILLAYPALDICLPDQMGRGVLEVTCSATWLFTQFHSRVDDSFFPILDAILQAKDGWDISLVRKAVIAAVREMHDLAVYRLLLEDWVVHSFAWSLGDRDTKALFDQISSSESSCQGPTSIMSYYLASGLLEPLALTDGMGVSNYRELAEMFCPNRPKDRGDCLLHSDWGIRILLPQLFSNRRSYTPGELERMIPRTRLIPHPK